MQPFAGWEGRMYCTLVEDHQGELSIRSFGGKDRAEERRFAHTIYRRVLGVYDTLGEARRELERVRRLATH